ncbi:MAG: hypothetical protein R2824_23175 [Saprospiraceae bacterium]
MIICTDIKVEAASTFACWYNPDAAEKTEEVEPTYEIRLLRELDQILD